MSTSFNKINLTVKYLFLSYCYPNQKCTKIPKLSALRGREISVISIGWKNSILFFMTYE